MKGFTILSTKKLKFNQKELLLNAGVSFVEYNAIGIEYLNFKAPSTIENAIFTSQNGVRSIQHSRLKIKHCFCVGQKTKALLEELGYTIITMSEYGADLAAYLIKNHNKASFYQFCGTIRRDEIPSELKKANIPLSEITTYHTVLKPKKFERIFDAVLFLIFGAPIEYYVFIAFGKEFYNYLLHSNLNWSLGWVGKYILISPTAHRIHHSISEKHFDKNFGTFFIWWDKIFGTYYHTTEEVIIGVKNTPYNKHGFWKDMIIGLNEFIDAIFRFNNRKL